MNSWMAAERKMSVNPRSPPATFCPEPSPPSTGLFLKASVVEEPLKIHLENPREMKIQARIFFDTLPITVQWTWSEDLVTSFLLKWMLLTFLLSVWKAGIPFPWWGILAPLCSVQPEFRGGKLHPCRGSRRDAQVHGALLPDTTVHISGEKQNGWRWGGETDFWSFFFL